MAALAACSSDGPGDPAATSPIVAATASAPIDVASTETAPEPTTSASADVQTSAPPDPSGSAAVEPPPEIGVVRDGRCIPRRVKTHGPPDRGDAIGSFRRAWEGCVARSPAGQIASVTSESMRRSEFPFQAKKEACRAIKKRLERVMVGLPPQVVTFGSAAALDVEGECWSVFYAGGMKNEVEGVVDAKNLDLLFGWRVPEG
jgi:hypothetical protein